MRHGDREENNEMPGNPIVYVLLRDLQVCVAIACVAVPFVTIIALPMTFRSGYQSDRRFWLWRLISIWLVGFAYLTGGWIALTAVTCFVIENFFLQTGIPSARANSPLALLVVLPIAGCIANIVLAVNRMLRVADPAFDRPPWRFSLQTLLIAQFVILFLCGLWMMARRAEIERIADFLKFIRDQQPH